MSFRLPNADGYILDFNGTLLWDTAENREAWNTAAVKARGKELTEEEFRLLNGRTDEETVLYLLPDVGEDGHTALINFKERIYKELCLSHGLTLSPGSEEILGFLKENGKRMAIASSAPKMNMEWYIPEYGLERFFERRNIIAGRSDIPSKPDPAIFRLAMEMIGTEPERTVIFEDSASGVKAAIASGAFLVVRIDDGSAEGADDERVRNVRSFSELTLNLARIPENPGWKSEEGDQQIGEFRGREAFAFPSFLLHQKVEVPRHTPRSDGFPHCIPYHCRSLVPSDVLKHHHS